MDLSRWLTIPPAALLLTAASLQVAGEPKQVTFDEHEKSIIARMTGLGAPPADPTNSVADDPRAAQLGKRLFFDLRLSGDASLNCAHCHDPKLAFSDGKPLSEGKGTAGRNAPGLINAAYQRWLFWDGRADTLWSQALQPIENPVEMDGNRVELAHRLANDAQLNDEYERVFGALPEMDLWPRAARPEAGDTPLGRAWSSMLPPEQDAANRVFANLGKALAAYERQLVGGHSAFDRFARGLAGGDEQDLAAMDLPAQRGLKLFIGKAGCRQCHTGPLLSDGEFHDLQLRPLSGGERTDPARLAAIARVESDPFNAAGNYSDSHADEATEHLRYLGHNPELWGAIRTPSLRNVALTPPYMDQGQLADLEAVLRFYSTREGAAPAGHHQEKVLQPLNLSDVEMVDLIAFLRALTEDPVPEPWREPPK